MTNYELALAAHNEAIALYRAATEAYYAGRIGDEEFSIARVAKRVADAVFDEAFDEASRWEWEDAERAADEDLRASPSGQASQEAELEYLASQAEYYDQFAS
jgi:hypothetical protein